MSVEGYQARVRCEICDEIIAVVDVSALAYPMTGAMFESIDDGHGFPSPFYHDADWEHMRCPWCHKRPFIRSDHEVLLEDGRIVDVKSDASARPCAPIGLASVSRATYEDEQLEREWEERMQAMPVDGAVYLSGPVMDTDMLSRCPVFVPDATSSPSVVVESIGPGEMPPYSDKDWVGVGVSEDKAKPFKFSDEALAQHIRAMRAEGKSYREIGTALHISKDTARNLYKKSFKESKVGK